MMRRKGLVIFTLIADAERTGGVESECRRFTLTLLNQTVKEREPLRNSICTHKCNLANGITVGKIYHG